jgi:predicted component of type VI protein secretion system
MAIFFPHIARVQVAKDNMLLEHLPAKAIHRLLKSVTWTEVAAAYGNKHMLRRLIARVAPSRWVTRVRKKSRTPMSESAHGDPR